MFKSPIFWRLGLAALVLVCLLGLLQGADWFSLARLQMQYHDLQAWYVQSPWTARALFFGLYLILASAAVPGIVVLTLAGGAIFGFAWGLVLVSFASTLGATLTLVTVRHVLPQTIASAMGPRVQALLRNVTKGLEREGVFFLLSLRLIPLIPFGLINVVMAFTRMPIGRFYLVSQLGMLPTTILYLQAAAQLAALHAASDVLAPELMLVLLGLGLAIAVLPFIAKRVLHWIALRKKLSAWKRPRRFDYNLIVIGGGAAGLVSAYVAAHAQTRVALIEAAEMGGDCLNRGCVPSKALIQSARVAHQLHQAAQFGLQAGPLNVDLAAVMHRLRAVIAAIAPHDSVQRYQGLGVDVFQAQAYILDPWTVELRRPGQEALRMTARRMVLATGAKPHVPDIPGLSTSGFVTSDTLWDALAQRSELPRRIAILGGGPVGCELAQAFARLGSQVSLIESGSALLGREDADVSALVQQALERDGVRVFTQHRAVRCESAELPQQQGLLVLCENAPKRPADIGASTVLGSSGVQAGEFAVPFDLLICATGRDARLAGFGLENLGLATGQALQTNEFMQTEVPTLFAAGDVAGPYQSTHAAAHQAWYASVNALLDGWWALPARYGALPSTVYVAPEVARVGLNEKQAKARGVPYEVNLFSFADLDRALCDAPAGEMPAGFVKVLTPPGRDRLLGVTIVGDQAAELLAPYVLAMRHRLGLKAMLSTIHSYPTLSESARQVAGQWQRAHLPQWPLRWLRRWLTWRRG